MSSTIAADRRRSAYHYTGGRDHRLDLIRGYALFAMAIDHYGLTNSYLHIASGRGEFIISAAETFFFVSGFTLGFISIGTDLTAAVRRTVRRLGLVYAAAVGCATGFALLSGLTGVELWGIRPSGKASEIARWLFDVATMRASFYGSEILVAYVIYMALAPFVLWALNRGRAKLIVALLIAAYVFSQVAPEQAALPFASFRALIPNSPLFMGAMVIGYHRHDLQARYERFRARRALDNTVLLLAAVLIWLHVTNWSAWPQLGTWITHGQPDDILSMREDLMPPVPFLVVALYLRAMFVIVDRYWEPLARSLGWFLLPLGEASLFTYLFHLLAIPILWNISGLPDAGNSAAVATWWTLAFLAFIYAAVRVRAPVWPRVKARWRSTRVRQLLSSSAGGRKKITS